jgi:LEA14-like dessication related protein
MVFQKKYFNLFFIVLAIVATSCSLKPVELKNMGDVDVQSINNNIITLKVDAVVNNPNSRLTLKNSELYVYMKDMEVGKITQMDKIIIEGKSAKKYTTRLKVELTGLKGGMLSALSLFNGKKPEFKISGEIKISMPFYWKTLHIKDYPIHL